MSQAAGKWKDRTSWTVCIHHSIIGPLEERQTGVKEKNNPQQKEQRGRGGIYRAACTTRRLKIELILSYIFTAQTF